MRLHFEVCSADAMLRLGECLGSLLRGGEVFSLSGPLGVGKTTFVKGVARGLGVAALVTSPSFAIIHVHEGRLRLVHCDFYRLESPHELDNTGFEDYLGTENVVMAEWGAGFLQGIPGGVTEVCFVGDDLGREVSAAVVAERDLWLVKEWMRKWQSWQ